MTYISREIHYRIRKIDWIFIAMVMTLNVLSVMLLTSAGDNFYEFALKHLLSLIFFLPIYAIVALLDIKFFYRNAYVVYVLCFLLLLVAEVLGHKAMGAQRWIRFGPINFQPSELMKIGVVLALARYFHDLPLALIGKIRYLLIPITIALLPVAFILRQPNLGTSLIILAIAASIFFSAGVKIWKFVLLFITSIASAPIIWCFLHAYQKKRVLTFLNPETDPLGAGYNILQSMIAIGSGGFIGQGWQQGPQSQLNFLPEKHTDFIFTILAEEFGFIGVLCTFMLVLLLYIYGIISSLSFKNQFARLLSAGVLTMFMIHVLINTAMISGLLPVVGVPFPLLSYGGSNQLCIMLAFSIFIAMRCNSHKNI